MGNISRSLSITALILFGSTLFAQTAFAQTATVSISGIVVTDSGAPMAGTKVYYKTAPTIFTDRASHTRTEGPTVNSSVVTAKDGTFSATGLPAGVYWLCADILQEPQIRSCDWGLGRTKIDLTTASSATNVKLQITTGTTLTFQVNDPSSHIKDAPAGSALPGSTGNFRIFVVTGTMFRPAQLVSVKGNVHRYAMTVPPAGTLHLLLDTTLSVLNPQALAVTPGKPGDTITISGARHLQPDGEMITSMGAISSRIALLAATFAPLNCATTPPVNLQTHYISLGTQDTSVAMVSDAAGNLFIVSDIGPPDSPSIRVTKTDPNGNVVATMNLGQGVRPYAAAVDFQGNLFVAGNGLVAKIDNALANILATSGIGGTAITTDGNGNVYLTGAAPAGFQTTPSAYQSNATPGASYVFVAELSNDLGTVISATLFGGSQGDCDPRFDACRMPTGPGLPAATTSTAIALDSSGSILIAGYTTATPAKLGQSPYNYGFVAKFSSDLTSLAGSAVFNPVAGAPTYFRGMAFDAQGNVVLVGSAALAGPIPAGTVQPSPPYAGGGGIVLEFDSSLSNFLWGTYFGAGPLIGSGVNGVQGVEVDSQGNLWITGMSMASELPNSSSNSLANLPFVAELTPDGTSVLNLISSQFGGAAITATPGGGLAVLSSTDSFLMTGSPDQPALLMVANSANNQSSGTIAPAELISLYGTAIGPDSPLGGTVVDGAFTNSLGGYQVLFNGVPAPLLYAGPNQINVVSPVEIAGQQTASIQVAGPNGNTVFPNVFVGDARPQIFSQEIAMGPNPPLITWGVATNQDDTLNSVANPAPEGSIVTVWATGTGLAGSPLPDGSIATTAAPANLPVTASASDGTPLQVSYAGQAPGAIQGLTQINVQIPASLVLGGPLPFPIYIGIGGAMSASATIEITTNAN